MQENINNQPYVDDESEIDIIEMISKLWKRRSMLITWCVVGAILGLIIGFSLPKNFSASALLAPENTDPKSNSLSSFASIAGINLQQGTDAISAEMYPDVVHSTPFIFSLFDLPVSFHHNNAMMQTSLLDYMLNYQKEPWWSPIIRFPFELLSKSVQLIFPRAVLTSNDQTLNPYNLPKEERDVVKFFAENIMVYVDKKSGRTSISLELQDPCVVYTVVNAIVERLKLYMSDYRTSKARQDAENLFIICEQRKLDYYNAQQALASYIDSNKNVILQSAQTERERLQQEMNLAYQVYSQVATQLESARIQEQQAKPVFAIIQPPVVPLKKTSPSKAKILVLFTFLAGCSAAVWILFGEDYWRKLKEIL